MASTQDDSLSLSLPKDSSLVRKLRKKLRQIEKLERVERELTEEEEIKLDAKEELREELQNLIIQEEKNMVALTEGIKQTTLNGNNDQMIHEIETMGEEKSGYIISEKMIGNNESENDDIMKEKLAALSNGKHVTDVTETTEMNGKNGTHDDKPENHTEETNGNHDKQTEDNAGEWKDEEDEDKGEEGETKEKTPIQLTITKKSLRQRNRGSHTALVEPAVIAKNNPCSDDVTPKHLFSDLTMTIQLLEGHFQDVCSVDLDGDYVVSGGRDTTVKLWTASSAEELKSFGGHTATVTGVKFMKDKKHAAYPNVISGSYDCSIRVWNMEDGTSRCIYVYSPVVCLDYLDGKVAVGTEGGKVEVYNVDTGDQLLSIGTHDLPVSAVKLLPEDKVASGSADGVLKIYNISIAQTEPIFALDPTKVEIKQSTETENPDSPSKASTLSMSKITCISCFNDLVIYGDEGFNIKVLDHKKGEITKVRNNLQEFCPTESLCVTSVQRNDYLFSVGSDVDLGDAYINIRSLPDLKYFGTIRDDHNNTGPITSVSIAEVDNSLRFVSAGQQLRVWDQSPKRAKKRKSPVEDDSSIPCKFINKYTEPRESEPESDSDETTSSQSNPSTSKEESTESATSQRWCLIL